MKHGAGVVDSKETFGKRRIGPRFGRSVQLSRDAMSAKANSASSGPTNLSALPIVLSSASAARLADNKR